MAVLNKPENRNTNEAHDLGQISTDHPTHDLDTNIYTNAGQMREAFSTFNPNPWVVVEFAGTDREQIVIDFPTAREAFRYIERNYCEDECDVDVMKRRNDGVLTTEY